MTMRFTLLLVTSLRLAGSVLAQVPQTSLRKPADFDGMTDQRAKSIAHFEEMSKVTLPSGWRGAGIAAAIGVWRRLRVWLSMLITGMATPLTTGTVVAGALPPRLTAETGLKAQRAEAIKWAMPYPPRMTAAMLPATTARRNAAVMVYSMEDHVRPTQQHPAPQFGEPQSRGSAQCFILPVPQRRNRFQALIDHFCPSAAGRLS
jgi:hypothetical protein